MRILAVNWLDLLNPQGGGAEIHFFEIFRRLVEKGHDVTLVASGWPGCRPGESVRGIDVVRVGGRYSFAARARSTVRKLLSENKFDVVVEDINKVPLYLPAVTEVPVYVIVPHLFGTTAFQQASWPVGAVVWLSEQPIPFVYRDAPFHVISESTRADLVRRGMDEAAVRVIYPGVDHHWLCPDPAVPRHDDPTFLFTGRLQRYKGVETAIRALASILATFPRARLQVAGSGDDLTRLVRSAAQLGIADRVDFLGYVEEEAKRDLMRRAWAVVFPSAKEGWGMTNIEAAACGTPAIASDSPGLRETAIHEETGLLVPHGDVSGFAAAMVRFASDPEMVARLGVNARSYAERFSWDVAASQTEEHLGECL